MKISNSFKPLRCAKGLAVVLMLGVCGDQASGFFATKAEVLGSNNLGSSSMYTYTTKIKNNDSVGQITSSCNEERTWGRVSCSGNKVTWIKDEKDYILEIVQENKEENILVVCKRDGSWKVIFNQGKKEYTPQQVGEIIWLTQESSDNAIEKGKCDTQETKTARMPDRPPEHLLGLSNYLKSIL